MDSINSNVPEGSPGMYSVDLGEGIDYDVLGSEDSDEQWLEDSDNERPSKKRKSNAPVEPQVDQKFKLKACFYIKNFKGQRNGDNVGGVEIEADTAKKMIESIWTNCYKYLHYEAIIQIPDEGTSSAVSAISFKDTKPTIDDIDKFLMVSETVSKRYFPPSLINSKLLRGWLDRELTVIVYRYSLSVTSSQLWGKLKSQLFEPVSCDRAGAPSNVLLVDTIQQLKNEHREHYVSDEINWSIWATYILKQPENLRGRAICDAPPLSIIKLFRPKPLQQDIVLESCRKDLRVSKSVVDFFADDLKCMRAAYNNVSAYMTDLGTRISAMEKKVDEFRVMLTSMNETVTPLENSFSHSLSEEVTDCNDVDHEQE